MKRILIALLCLAPLVAWATRVEMPEEDGTALQCLRAGGTTHRPVWADCSLSVEFSTLPTAFVGEPGSRDVWVCHGCLPTNPCTEGTASDVALAIFIPDDAVNGHWSCNGTGLPGRLTLETTTTTTTTTTTSTTEETSTTTTTEESTTTTTL